MEKHNYYDTSWFYFKKIFIGSKYRAISQQIIKVSKGQGHTFW